MDHIQIDLKEFIMQADDNDGYKYMLTVVDHFSNCAFAYPLFTKKPSETATHLMTLFKYVGPPKVLQHDNGMSFLS